MDFENISLSDIQEKQEEFEKRTNELYPQDVIEKRDKDIEYHQKRIEQYEEMLKEENNEMDYVQKANNKGTIKELIEDEKKAIEKAKEDADKKEKELTSDITLAKQRRLMDEKSKYYTQAAMKLEETMKEVKLDMQILLQRGDPKTKFIEANRLQDKLNELQKALDICKDGKEAVKIEQDEFVEKNGLRSLKDAEEQLDREEQEKSRITAMEKYEKQVEQYKKLQEMEAKKQAELDEVNEKLKNDPDNKDLQEQKEKLDKDLAKIKTVKPQIEKDIEEAKKLLDIDDKGKDKGDDDNKGKGKGDDDANKGKGKGDDADDKGKGKGDSEKISATDYYSSLGIVDRYKTKVQAWEKLKGKDAGLLTKALMWLPRPDIKKVSEQYLEDGYIKPIYDDVKLLGKGEEPKPAPAKEDKGDNQEPPKDPFKVDDETKKKTEEVEKVAVQKQKEEETLAKINELLAQCPPEKRENLLKALSARTGVKPQTSKSKTEQEKGGAEK